MFFFRWDPMHNSPREMHPFYYLKNKRYADFATSSLEILKGRCVSGEITEEEYKKIKKDLEE